MADTSVWIEFFRGNSLIGNNLEMLIIADSVEICGVVLFELLQGIKSDSEKLKINDILLNLPYVEVNKIIWQRSAEIAFNIKKERLYRPIFRYFDSSFSNRKQPFRFYLR